MKALLFDPFSGASGSMLLGSLIDLGADVGKIRSIAEPVANVTLSVGNTLINCAGSARVRFDPLCEHPERSYGRLVRIIRESKLPGIIEKDVLAIFGIMANAEAKISGEAPEETLFRYGSIACVIGSCVALRDLDPETVLTKPINTGNCITPVALEILKTGGLTFYGRGDRELLTPVGAAILAHFAEPVDNIPMGRAMNIGYGAGSGAETPDLLRTLLMELKDDIREDTVEILETSVDNVSGEILGSLFDRLMALGARDVTVSPATMKKGRPGHIIRVVSLPHMSDTLAREIMTETGTLGIRVMTGQHRFTAARRVDIVTLSIGDKFFETPVKIASDKAGKIFHISAEYEACKKIASAADLPLREVMRRAEEEGWKRFGNSST